MAFDNQSLQPGTIIRGPQLNYKVIRKLGQGGFGITYLVEAQVKIGNIVVPVRFALKEHFISSLCTRDEATQKVCVTGPATIEVQNSMRSFIKEASRLQELDFAHRNIVKINEVFEANNTAYYVMEYLDGETLDEYVEREGPLSFKQASDFLRPIAEAVAELHEKHLTHYDIKPGNIILTREEDGELRAVLIDFGLSKHYDREGRATSTVSSGGYSPGYSPVEQYAGIRTFTPQADVYALAATLWFCLKGEAPLESVLGPVNTIEVDLDGLATPAQIVAMRHAMAILSDQRTADAETFVREVFDGASAQPQSRVTQPRPATPPPPVPPSRQTQVRIKESSTEEIKPSSPIKSRAWNKWVIVGVVVFFGIFLVASLLIPKEQEQEVAIESEQITAAVDESPVETAVEHVVMPEAVNAASKEESPRVDTVVATPRTEKPESNGTMTWGKEDIVYSNEQNPQTQKIYGRKTYNNFDLATVINGEPRFFSQSEWNAVPESEINKYIKKGVVVKGGSVPAGKNNIFKYAANPTAGYASDFIVELESGRAMNWQSAMQAYSKRLPDIYQGYFMAKSNRSINTAIKDFGGEEVSTSYWTYTETDSDYAWYVSMKDGFVSNCSKSIFIRVRAVAPVPVAH